MTPVHAGARVARVSDSSPRAATLEYVEVHQLRHVRPGTRVEFGRGINVVLGHNGVGKTTLLELVAALEQGNLHAFAREGFSISFAMTSGAARLQGRLSNAFGRIRDFRFVGEYRKGDEVVGIESNGDHATLTAKDRRIEAIPLFVKDADLRRGNPLLTVELELQLQLALELDDTARLASLAYSGSRCTRMEEGVETFTALLGPSTGSALPKLGLTIVTSDIGNVVTGQHVDFSNRLVVRASDNVVEISPDLFPALRRFLELSQYVDATLLLTRVAHEASKDLEIATFGNPFIRFKLHNGNEIPHQQLSYGEKRLLTFLIKLYDHPAAIVVDELANGMHHAWLDACIDMLVDFETQAFLSSQNPLLLDGLPINEEGFGKHGVVVCESDEQGHMVWRNLSERETRDFLDSLAVGIMHISEIMRSKGLW